MFFTGVWSGSTEAISGRFIFIEVKHPILTIMFLKNILRIFEVKILIMYKNIQPQPKT